MNKKKKKRSNEIFMNTEKIKRKNKLWYKIHTHTYTHTNVHVFTRDDKKMAKN